MCGLVGVFGNITSSLANVFSQMLVVDSVRGMDSTGVLSVDKQLVPRMRKALGPAPFLLIDRKYKKKISSRADHILLMGHNRAATKGKVELANAHPFQHGHIILAHNGTLNTTWDICGRAANPFGTDSEAICASLAKNGLDWTWENLFGAAALTWWDMREKSFNFISNGDRPLRFAMMKDLSAFLYASEDWMFREICNRSRTVFNLDPVLKINPHFHFKFTLSEDGKTVETATREVDRPIRPFVQSAHHTNHHKSRVVNPKNRPSPPSNLTLPKNTDAGTTRNFTPINSGKPEEVSPVFWDGKEGCWYEKLPDGNLWYRRDCRNIRIRPAPIHLAHLPKKPDEGKQTPLPGFGTILPDGRFEVVTDQQMERAMRDYYDCVVCGAVLEDEWLRANYFALVETTDGMACMCESCADTEMEQRTSPE